MRSSSVFCVGWRNTEGTSVIDRCTALVIFHRAWYDTNIEKLNVWRKVKWMNYRN